MLLFYPGWVFMERGFRRTEKNRLFIFRRRDKKIKTDVVARGTYRLFSSAFPFLPFTLFFFSFLEGRGGLPSLFPLCDGARTGVFSCGF